MVWYVEKEGEIVGIIALGEPDTYAYRQEAKNYPDCRVWSYSMIGWAYMDTNNIRSAIWRPTKAPDTVILAKMIGE